MALSNVALFGGCFLTPVFAGMITDKMGWTWTFNFVAIFSGAGLPLLFFFVPETAFKRPNYLNTDFEGDSEHARLSQEPDSQIAHDASNQKKDGSDGAVAPISRAEPKPESVLNDGENITDLSKKSSYIQSLKLFNGRKTDENFFKLLLRPFPLFLHPGILWVSYNNRFGVNCGLCCGLNRSVD